MPRTSLKLIALSSVALMLAACGGDDQEANTGQPPPQQCPPGQVWNGQYCAQQMAQQPGQCPPGQVWDGQYCVAQGQQQPPPQNPPPQGTGPGGIPTTNAGPAAQPVDPAAAGAVTQLIQPFAQQHLPPGAKPLGQAMAGNFAQGQSLETTVQMQPGKCYTVVGVAVPTVQNLDIQLAPQVQLPGMQTPVVAQDKTTGPNAVVGEKPNCFKWALPMAGPMKIILSVTAGQGLAAAQVYEK